jgi:hypothetical protein
MIETDEQRRWWFATHPEYSWNRRGDRRPGKGRSPADSNKSPSRPMLAGPLITPDTPLNVQRPGAVGGMYPGPSYRPPHLGGGGRPPAPAPPPPATFSKPPGAGGPSPGEWVDVARSRIGIQHQSKMSGHPIQQKDGKLYIKEYKLNGVYFDDYAGGKLYEYKGSYGKLINKLRYFYDWVRGAKKIPDQAKKQAGAAQGTPVIWRVGKDQVKAFKKAVGNVPGVEIVP